MTGHAQHIVKGLDLIETFCGIFDYPAHDLLKSCADGVFTVMFMLTANESAAGDTHGSFPKHRIST